MAVILDEALSGQPLEQVAAVPCDIVYQFFGKEISMGKGQGLMGMTSMVQEEAKKRLAERS
jgi:cysteine desulfuration protein SufE